MAVKNIYIIDILTISFKCKIKKKPEPTPEYRKGGLGFYPGGLGYNCQKYIH
jgi:hypothetical protein